MPWPGLERGFVGEAEFGLADTRRSRLVCRASTLSRPPLLAGRVRHNRSSVPAVRESPDGLGRCVAAGLVTSLVILTGRGRLAPKFPTHGGPHGHHQCAA